MHEQWIPGPFLRVFEWAWVRGYLCSCLCIVCSNVSEAPMLALDLCVWFCSCLWIVSVFKTLMLALDLCVQFCSCPCSYSVFKCFRSSHACPRSMCLVLFLPVDSVSVQSSHACPRSMCLVLFLPM